MTYNVFGGTLNLTQSVNQSSVMRINLLIITVWLGQVSLGWYATSRYLCVCHKNLGNITDFVIACTPLLQCSTFYYLWDGKTIIS